MPRVPPPSNKEENIKTIQTAIDNFHYFEGSQCGGLCSFFGTLLFFNKIDMYQEGYLQYRLKQYKPKELKLFKYYFEPHLSEPRIDLLLKMLEETIE